MTEACCNWRLSYYQHLSAWTSDSSNIHRCQALQTHLNQYNIPIDTVCPSSAWSCVPMAGFQHPLVWIFRTWHYQVVKLWEAEQKALHNLKGQNLDMFLTQGLNRVRKQTLFTDIRYSNRTRKKSKPYKQRNFSCQISCGFMLPVYVPFMPHIRRGEVSSGLFGCLWLRQMTPVHVSSLGRRWVTAAVGHLFLHWSSWVSTAPQRLTGCCNPCAAEQNEGSAKTSLSSRIPSF